MLERIHLNILREVERRGSLTVAAETLHLTQPALSHAIKKLERQLGTPLWKRKGRGLQWTPAGAHLLGVAKRLLPRLEQAELRLYQYARGERGLLRIGIECHPCHRWLLHVVKPFLAQWPDVEVDVRGEFQFGGMQALLDEEIDLLVTPDPLDKPALRFEPVFDYELVLAVSQQHPLAAQRVIEPKMLADEVLLSYPVELMRLDIYTRFLYPAGILPRQHKTIESTDILLQMVASQRGVSALPRWLVDEYRTQLPIVAVRLGRGIDKQICLSLREADRTLVYLQAFIDLARVGWR